MTGDIDGAPIRDVLAAPILRKVSLVANKPSLAHVTKMEMEDRSVGLDRSAAPFNIRHRMDPLTANDDDHNYLYPIHHT